MVLGVTIFKHIKPLNLCTCSCGSVTYKINALGYSEDSDSGPAYLCCLIRPQGHKTFFMLNLAEHEILNAHKYENVKKFSIFRL